MEKETIDIIIKAVQIIFVPLIIWISVKISQIHRGNKLTDIKAEALVDTLSTEFGNGEFRKRYDQAVEKKKSNYKFVKGK